MAKVTVTVQFYSTDIRNLSRRPHVPTIGAVRRSHNGHTHSARTGVYLLITLTPQPGVLKARQGPSRSPPPTPASTHTTRYTQTR